MVFLFIPLA